MKTAKVLNLGAALLLSVVWLTGSVRADDGAATVSEAPSAAEVPAAEAPAAPAATETAAVAPAEADAQVETEMPAEVVDVAGAGGASLVVFGLVGVAVIWAPENEIEFELILWMGHFVRSFGVRIWVMGALYFVMQLAYLAAGGFHMGSEAAHLIGAVFGAAAAVAFLRLQWVDCENWDLLSVWQGKHRQNTSEWITSRKTEPSATRLAESTEKPAVDSRVEKLICAIDEARLEDARRLFGHRRVRVRGDRRTVLCRPRLSRWRLS
ncbi:MAG: rhomboid family intramembrane serine protease, partial [Myxococcales bacterium]|nr:rhomboid family intramembrane serine protease [Myxococcales bacterium]